MSKNFVKFNKSAGAILADKMLPINSVYGRAGQSYWFVLSYGKMITLLENARPVKGYVTQQEQTARREARKAASAMRVTSRSGITNKATLAREAREGHKALEAARKASEDRQDAIHTANNAVDKAAKAARDAATRANAAEARAKATRSQADVEAAEEARKAALAAENAYKALTRQLENRTREAAAASRTVEKAMAKSAQADVEASAAKYQKNRNAAAKAAKLSKTANPGGWHKVTITSADPRYDEIMRVLGENGFVQFPRVYFGDPNKGINQAAPKRHEVNREFSQDGAWTLRQQSMDNADQGGGGLVNELAYNAVGSHQPRRLVADQAAARGLAW